MTTALAMSIGTKRRLRQDNDVIARFRLPALLAVVAVLGIACAETDPDPVAFSGDLTAGNPTAEEAEEGSGAVDPPTARELTGDESDQLDAALETSPAGCNLIDTGSCFLPFPSDFLTVEDPDSPTLRRVDFPEGQLQNASGVPLDPSAWNELDGFSPATPIVVLVPGLDEDKTALPPASDIAMSVTAESATVVLDLDTGQLVPHWAELDQRAEDPAQRSLIIHPASSLLETHRFAVALRDMRASDGSPIEAPITYQVLRDNITTSVPAIEDLRPDYETVFTEMAEAGIERRNLYMSWWFTVASAESLAGNVLSMREDAMGKLNGGAPAFEVTDVRTDDLQDGIAKVVEGTYEVPLYLESDQPGALMTENEAGQPTQSGVMDARFVCTVPEQAMETGEARPVVYGHGLLGGAEEAASGHVQVTAAALNAVYCSTDAIGLADADTAFAGQVAGDINNMVAMSDRLQQAILNYLYLGRLMINVEGLATSEEFTTDAGAIALNTIEAYWDGNSQGAILGGAVTAVAQDWTKAVLGVGGMGYSTLLQRSVDFDPFYAIMSQAYPDPVEQQVVFGVLQMMWDRGETAGYVQHLTDRPYSLTPPHQVVMDVAFGDHQVANVTADNIARSLNIPLYMPVLPEEADEVEDSVRFYDLSPIRQFPHTGSALFYWYSGTLAPPDGNITPMMGELFESECADSDDTDVACADPHEDPRRQPEVIEQKDAFFAPDGVVLNVCRDEPCLATPRSEFDY
jgi:hypothetical protein